MAVDELIDLDVSHSPPSGQAKDAANLAEMIGANFLDDTLTL
ncbi:hypothetical protein [Microbacterium sp. NPDC087592]